MTLDTDEKLPAAYFRAICTALWGPRYYAAAAQALNVQESRIKYWSDDKQDDTPHQVSLGVKRELEQLFVDRVAESVEVMERVNLMADLLEYLDELIEMSGAPPYH